MQEKQKVNIAIYGNPFFQEQHIVKDFENAFRLGKYLIRYGANVLIPTLPGFHLWVAKGVKEEGSSVIAFSPAASFREHLEIYKLPIRYMDIIIYSGFGFSGNDVLLSRSADASIFVYGGVEAVHEFWLASRERKVIGILKSEFKEDDFFFHTIQNDSRFDERNVFFANNPEKMAKEIIRRARLLRLKKNAESIFSN